MSVPNRDLSQFAQFSTVHFITLLFCAVVTIAFTLAGRRVRQDPVRSEALRVIVVLGCIGSWLLTVAHGFVNRPIDWSVALPLQFCNLANLIGAVAVWRKTRFCQALLYYWAFILCIWAFLTPALDSGPLLPGFWVFWVYHVFILVSVFWVLLVDDFRPRWKDLGTSVFATLAFMGALAVINLSTGWNYGFVGRGMPGNPTPIDFLGPFPIRLLYMALIGTALFTIITLPWQRKHRSGNEAS